MVGTELMTSRTPRVKAARKLTRRASRMSERRFLAEGPQSVREALSLPGCALEVFATYDASERHGDLRLLAGTASVPWRLVDDPGLASLCDSVSPQGLVAVCAFVDATLDTVVARAPGLVVVAANIRDPGNAGTLIRSADAAGAAAVVIAGESVDPYNGKAVRASVGSLFHLPVVTEVSVEESLAALRSGGLTVLAADGGGDLSLDEAADSGLLSKPTAWVFGNEAWGLPQELRELADHVVSVPIYGRAESLNLATAAAICLYTSARAQRTRYR